MAGGSLLDRQLLDTNLTSKVLEVTEANEMNEIYSCCMRRDSAINSV